MVQPAYDYCIKASHVFNLLDAKGKKGSPKVAKIDEIWSDTNIILLTLFRSVLKIFHGSWSAKYLFPCLAIFIYSLQDSLNLNFSTSLLIK